MVFILVQLCVSLCFVCEGSPTFPLELEIFFCHIVVPKLFLSLCCTAEMGKDFEALVVFLIDVEKKKMWYVGITLLKTSVSIHVHRQSFVPRLSFRAESF